MRKITGIDNFFTRLPWVGDRPRLMRNAPAAYDGYMIYEWNEAKRAANLAKHGVDFADAVAALEDPFNSTLEDGDAEGESRFATLGINATGSVLYVVWTKRADNIIRVISARKASPGEVRHYPR